MKNPNEIDLKETNASLRSIFESKKMLPEMNS